MSDPIRGGYVRKNRSTQDTTRTPQRTPMTAEDSLMVEAYGNRGAAFRKTAKAFGEGMEKKDEAESGVIAKIKSFFGRDKKEPK